MDDEATLLEAEKRLQVAMASGNVRQIESLVDESAIFTDQTGRRVTRAEDLDIHRSRVLAIDGIEPIGKPMVKSFGSLAVVLSTLRITGHFAGTSFSGQFAYTRVWRQADKGWMVVAAHASPFASTESDG